MSITVNTYTFEGSVVMKKGPFETRNPDMKVSFLYCRGTFMDRGNAMQHDVKFTVYSWKDNSRIKNLLPGDVIRLPFVIRGKINEEYLDKKYGIPSLWNELIPSGKIEVLDTSQQKLYDNKVDGMGEFPPPPKFKYGEDTKLEEETNDLPF
jgi:hypothetical protein